MQIPLVARVTPVRKDLGTVVREKLGYRLSEAHGSPGDECRLPGWI
jgi:hypothetical protein